MVPYIPSVLHPQEFDKIIQNMQFNNVPDLQAIRDEISTRLTWVYVRAQLKDSQKRRKRALGSINAVVSILRSNFA